MKANSHGAGTRSYEQLVEESARDHTFLAIEEPEAHLHPVLQRLVFRNYLKPRAEKVAAVEDKQTPAKKTLPGSTTVLVTTHSPHIASVAPLRSFLVLRESDGEGSVGRSLARIKLNERSVEDLERYLDVSRAEMMFARAVILVEGDAEKFLVPVLARELGVDLDEHGVVVCSIGGTHFQPFVSLVGGLALRFALLTDLDPTTKGNLGEARVVNGIMRRLLKRAAWEAQTFEQVLKQSPASGVFLNADTFELELARAGYGVEMATALTELLPKSRNAKSLLDAANKGQSLDSSMLMRLIERVGKGRFAQRLASSIPQSDGTCPEYIQKAIKYVL